MSAQRKWTLLEVDIAVRGRTPDAEAAVEWFWRNGPFFERYSEFIRSAREWCAQPRIRAVLERLRPPRPVRKDELFPGLMDWLALSSALGLQAEVLTWFDERVAEGDLPLPAMTRLVALILERGRLRDFLAFAEPLTAVSEYLQHAAHVPETFSDLPDDVLESQLEILDCRVALWRRVAESERPGELAKVDAAIDGSERASAIRAWLARPESDLVERLLKHAPA